jgi:hypothetical protein
VNYGVSDIAIFGTNAETSSITASDPNGMEWGDTDEWGDSDIWANSEITDPTITQTQRSNSQALWLELENTIDRPCVLELTLDSAVGFILKAGTIDVDIASLYGGKNPQYGIDQVREDTSVSSELSNGARYYKKRDVLRLFTLTIFMLASDASDLLEFFETYGAVARPWKLTDEDNNDWLVYGYLISPGSNHPIVEKSYITMSVKEEL